MTRILIHFCAAGFGIVTAWGIENPIVACIVASALYTAVLGFLKIASGKASDLDGPNDDDDFPGTPLHP